MLKIEKFDGTKTYMFVDGSLATPEIMLQKNPAMSKFTHVLELNGDVVQAIMNLSALRGIYKIDKSLSEDDAILAIETITNTPPPEPPVAPEERLAAAQEFANLAMLPAVVAVKSGKTVEEDPYAKLLKSNFDKGLWNSAMLLEATKKGVLTTDQKDAITSKK